jgi:hypothetical protein
MEMEFELGCEYIAEAFKNDYEERVFTRWINGNQHIAYEEFKKQLGHVHAVEDSRTEESILESVKDILNHAK